MPKRPSTSIEEKLPPEKRLALAQEAQNAMRLARQLLKGKKYREAFEKFKAAISASNGTKVFPTSSEMMQMSKNYRPALVALKHWRAQKERLIYAHTADSEVIRQWEQINIGLNDKARILTVFRKLKNEGTNGEFLREFYWQVWRRLVEAKQYEDLREFFNKLGWITFLHVSQYDSDKWFPLTGLSGLPAAEIINDGALVYETAVALYEYGSANVIAEKLLSVEDTDATYAVLITAARRCKGTQNARELYQQARERLGARRVRKSKKAIGPLA